MQAAPAVIGIILVLLGCIIRLSRRGAVEKWVSFNIISAGFLIIVEYITGRIQLSTLTQMHTVYSVTVIAAFMLIILGCVNLQKDSD